MPFVFWNVTDVTVTDFYVKNPQLWSLNIMNGTNMRFNGIYNNATAVNARFGTNWVQNTDGFDTMDVNNVLLENFVYQGGDDCIAIKPRSYNVQVRNASCYGGNGMAIGSLGQYLQDSSVENVFVDDVDIIPANGYIDQGVYIKTWIGNQEPQSSYESAGLPRGGGWGVVRNMLFSNFRLHNSTIATAITQDSGKNGSYYVPSKMQISNVAFVNFSGIVSTTKSSDINSLGCSTTNPCLNIIYENVLESKGVEGGYLVENNTIVTGNGSTSM